jgi:hypothetical protein
LQGPGAASPYGGEDPDNGHSRWVQDLTDKAHIFSKALDSFRVAGLLSGDGPGAEYGIIDKFEKASWLFEAYPDAKTPPKRTGKRKSSESDDSRASTPDRNVKPVIFPSPPSSPAASARRQLNLPDQFLPSPVYSDSSARNGVMAAYLIPDDPVSANELVDSVSENGGLDFYDEDQAEQLIPCGGAAGGSSAQGQGPSASSLHHRPIFNMRLDAMSHVAFASPEDEQDWARYDPQEDFECGGEVELARVIGEYLTRGLRSRVWDEFFLAIQGQSRLYEHFRALRERRTQSAAKSQL